MLLLGGRTTGGHDLDEGLQYCGSECGFVCVFVSLCASLCQPVLTPSLCRNWQLVTALCRYILMPLGSLGHWETCTQYWWTCTVKLLASVLEDLNRWRHRTYCTKRENAEGGGGWGLSGGANAQDFHPGDLHSCPPWNQASLSSSVQT